MRWENRNRESDFDLFCLLMWELPYTPYNTTNKDRARHNRSNQTESENKMWNEVLRKR